MILNSENQQLNVIKDQAVRRLSVIDLDLNGYNVSSSEDFVKLGYHATKNKVLFWLNCGLGDIVRSSVASPLIKLAGTPLSEDEIPTYENDITDAFNDQFSSESISLSFLKLEVNLSNRTWFLTMAIIDNLTDSHIPINLEIIQ